jgi:hypothetical protein
MKRSGPLPRKTPLQRGKRLNPRSKKPRKFRDVNLQQHYRDQFDYCELTPWLHRNAPHLCDTSDYSLHLHHICAGHGGRYDFWTNFIRLSGTVHRWLTDEDTTSGAVLCVWRKVQKNEFDETEFQTCSGRLLIEWLELHRPEEPAIKPLWNELMAVSVRKT